MSSYRRSKSWFYNSIYVSFRDGRYEDGLNNASSYRLVQSSASFRKVYDSLTRVLDNIINKKENELNESWQGILSAIARLNILIEYQKNRGVLNQDLADGMKDALADLMRSLRSNPQQAKKEAEALKMALDATLAYKIVVKKREEEEEEFL